MTVSSEKKLGILLIENEPVDAEWVRRALAQEGKGLFELECVDRLSEGLVRLRKEGIGLVILDLNLPDGSGLEIFEKIHSASPRLPIVILTGSIQEEKIALEILKKGAQEYLFKGQIDARFFMRSLHYAIERKWAEQKMQEATQIKSDFISMVSHELRTPLAVVQESLNLLSDGTLGKLRGEQQEYLKLAESSIERLTRLINDVLDYQKLEAGFMEFQKAPQDLNQLIQEIIKGFLPVVDKKGLELRAQLDDKLPPVMCDKDKITQVLTNFLSNAMKFTEKGKITVASERGENWIRISVQDEGPGISKGDQSKLFQTFSQLKMEGIRKPGGTGLGLAISKKIIETHNGRTGVDSVLGKGSSFYFVLPIEERRSR